MASADNAAMDVEKVNDGDPRVGAWSSVLFGCCDDVGGCFQTIFCPWVTLGRIAQVVTQGATRCLYTRTFRAKLRSQYGIPEEPCGDCCVRCWCMKCALCQEYRELKARGFDMAHGWDGNRPPPATSPPQVNPEMSR